MYDDPKNHVFTLYPYLNTTIESAKGCVLKDDEGNEYIDLASGQLSANLGHGHPRLIEAVREQAGRIVHLGNRFFGTDTLEACQTVASVCQEGLDKVILCSTGTEANEMAIRIAKASTGHHEIVGIQQGYYGCSHETLSLSDYVGFIKGIGVRAPGLHRLICPDCRRCPLGLEYPSCQVRCAKMSAQILEKESTGDIAAFIVEPILGSGGIIEPPPEFFQMVRKLCDDYGALLIADEAQTGLGRTGRWMGMEHSGVVPDITVLSKGLGAGFPVAAAVTTEAIEQKCIAAPLANMSSHSFDPFGSSIATTVIQIIKEEGLVERAERVGGYLKEQLSQVVARHDILAGVRGRGLMLGMDVLAMDDSEQLDPMLSLALEGECLLRGVALGYSALSGVIRLLPSLTMTRTQIDQAMEILDQAATYMVKEGVDISRYMPTHMGSAMLAFSFIDKLEG